MVLGNTTVYEEDGKTILIQAEPGHLGVCVPSDESGNANIGSSGAGNTGSLLSTALQYSTITLTKKQ